MALVKIKLLSNLIIDGKKASPNDENKGVYVLDRPIAMNLIARKRAEMFGEVKEEKTPEVNKPEFDLKALKALADKLGVKYQQNIGGEKLNKKVLDEIKAKAEELKLEVKDEDALKAYKVLEQPEETTEDITEDELKAIADEAEIELPENAATDEIKKIVIETLEDYVSELKLEVVENETIKDTWNRIQDKLKENDN